MIKAVVLSALLSTALAVTCQSPQHSASTFSTTDGFFHFQTTFIAEFSLQCSNKIKDAPFFAVVNGKSHQVAFSEDVNKYQVSFSLDHAEAGAQTFNIEIFDEDTFATYSKAQRNGDSVSSIKPLFTIPLNHPGISRKSPVSSESVALVLSIVALYYAFVQKNQATA